MNLIVKILLIAIQIVGGLIALGQIIFFSIFFIGDSFNNPFSIAELSVGLIFACTGIVLILLNSFNFKKWKLIYTLLVISYLLEVSIIIRIIFPVRFGKAETLLFSFLLLLALNIYVIYLKQSQKKINISKLWTFNK